MDLMLQQNVEPNIVSYGTAISACARGGACYPTVCFRHRFLFEARHHTILAVELFLRVVVLR